MRVNDEAYLTETSYSGPENLTLQSTSTFCVNVFAALKGHFFTNIFPKIQMCDIDSEFIPPT